MISKPRPRARARRLKRLLKSSSSLANNSVLNPQTSRNRSARQKINEPAAQRFNTLSAVQSDTPRFSMKFFSSSRTRQPPPAHLPDEIRFAVAPKSAALGNESASTNMIQSPVAPLAPRLRAREI